MVDDFHLLKKLNCDTRYVLLTTTDKDIYVVTKKVYRIKLNKKGKI